MKAKKQPLFNGADKTVLLSPALLTDESLRMKQQLDVLFFLSLAATLNLKSLKSHGETRTVPEKSSLYRKSRREQSASTDFGGALTYGEKPKKKNKEKPNKFIFA